MLGTSTHSFAQTNEFLDGLPSMGHIPESAVDRSGKFTTRLSLWIPPARGPTPDLSLHYNSDHGNGILGVGWQIPLESIIRDRAGDLFHSSLGWGASVGPEQRLMNDAGAVTYHTLLDDGRLYEGSYEYCGATRCSWTARDRSGVRTDFGESVPTFVPALDFSTAPCAPVGATVCARANGADVTATTGPPAVDAWLLRRVTDRDGNYYEVTYTGDSADGSRVPRYIDYNRSSSPSSYYRVEFIYAERNDWTAEPNRHRRLLEELRISALDSNGDVLEVLRRHLFSYEISASTGRTLLASVAECEGYEFQPSPNPECKPAPSFQYTESTGAGEAQFSAFLPGINQADEMHFEEPWKIHVGDFNGDGFDDLARAYFNVTEMHPDFEGERAFARVVQVVHGGPSSALLTMVTHEEPATALAPSMPGSYYRKDSFVADFNRDGYDDIAIVTVSWKSDTICVMRGSPGGLQAIVESECTVLPANPDAPNFPISGGHDYRWPSSTHVLVGDVNGDQYPDLVSVYTKGDDGLSGSTGWTPHRRSPQVPPGVPLWHDAHTQVYLNDGALGFTSTFHDLLWPGVPVALTAHSPVGDMWLQGAALQDFDGDGLDDLQAVFSRVGHGTGGEILTKYGKGLANGYLTGWGDSHIQQIDVRQWYGTTLLVGDSNGDGRSDTALAYSGIEGGLVAGETYFDTRRASWGVGAGSNATVEHGRNVWSSLEATGPWVLRARDDDPAIQYPGPVYRTNGTGPEATGIPWLHSLADINGDQIDDLVLAYRGMGPPDEGATRIEFLLGTPNGEFVESSVAPTLIVPTEYFIDTASVPDLTVLDGDGTTRGPSISNPPPILADLNGDDQIDVLLFDYPLLPGMGTAKVAHATGSALGSEGFRALSSPSDSLVSTDLGVYMSGSHRPVPLDLNGDGSQDLLFVSQYQEHLLGGSWGSMVSLLGKPDLLRTIKTGLGGTVTINYEPRSNFSEAISTTDECLGWNESQQDVTSLSGVAKCGLRLREQDWLVESVRRDSGLGEINTEVFDYQNGRWMPGVRNDRRSLGFERTISIALETGYQTTTEWRQDFPFIGRIHRQTVLDAAGVVQTESVHEWDATTGYGAGQNMIVSPSAGYPADKAYYIRERVRTARMYEAGYIVHENVVTHAAFDNFNNPIETSDCQTLSGVFGCELKFSDFRVFGDWHVQPSLIFRESSSGHPIEATRFAYYSNRRLERTEKLLIADPSLATCGFANGEIDCSGEGRWIPVRSSLQYDSFGNIISETDALGHATATSYDVSFHAWPALETSRTGLQRLTSYNNEGNPITVLDVDNNISRTTEYDALGRTRFKYRPTPGGPPSSLEVEEATSFVGSGSFATGFASPFFGGTAFEGTQHLEIRRNRSASQSAVARVYLDGFGEPWLWSESSDLETVYVEFQLRHTAAGKLVRQTRPYGLNDANRLWTEELRDPRDRIIAISNVVESVGGGSQQTTMATTSYSQGFFNGGSTTTRTTVDANGSSRLEHLDSEGRLIGARDPSATKMLAIVLDDDGRPVQVTQPEGQVSLFRYDTLGWLRYEVDDQTGGTTYEYDDAGNEIAKTNQTGTTWLADYDADGRRTHVSTVDSLGQQVWIGDFFYDQWTTSLPTFRNGFGRPTEEHFPAGVRRFSYDDDGNIEKTFVEILGQSATIEAEFDWLGRMRARLFPNGVSVQYSYHDDGTPWTVTLETASGSHVIKTYSDFVADRRLEAAEVHVQQSGEIITLRRAYDDSRDFGRLSSIKAGIGGAFELLNLELSYDTAGLLTDVHDQRTNTLVGTNSTKQRATYGYDGRGWLTGSQTSYGAQSYAYDDNGRILEKDGFVYDYSPLACPQDAQCIEGSRGTSSFFVRRGVLGMVEYLERSEFGIVTDRRDYFYDAAGLLTDALVGGVLVERNTYDLSGLRVHRDTAAANGDNVSVRYYAPDLSVRASSDGSGPLTTVSVRGGFGEEIAELTIGVLGGSPDSQQVDAASISCTSSDSTYGAPEGLTYVINDFRSSPVARLNEDGVLVSFQRYSPYGRFLGDGVVGGYCSTGYRTSEHGFTGHIEDPGTDLIYMGARHYDPILGLFLGADDRVTSGGTSAIGYNRFAYANNNPIMFLDPDGHEAVLAAGAVVVLAVLAYALVAQSVESGLLGRMLNGIATLNSEAGAVVHDAFWATLGAATSIVLDQDIVGRAAVTEALAERYRATSRAKGREDTTTRVDPYHPNDDRSERENHLYAILDKDGDVAKVGISARRLNADGTSPRAQQQVNKWNLEEKGAGYQQQVLVKGIQGRFQAKLLEAAAATVLYYVFDEPLYKHKLPVPVPLNVWLDPAQ